jgi:hypothetical protein
MPRNIFSSDRQIYAFLIGLVCLSLLLATPARGAVDPHPAIPESVGLNIGFGVPRPGEVKMLAASGVRWVRKDMFWSAGETVKGQYNFYGYDQLLAALEQYKLRPIFILDYSNKLYDNDLSPYTDEGVQAFARWAAAAVTHFKGRRILWEMYNEPNGGFWRPKANVAAYVKLALAVGQAIQQVAPGEDYIGPASIGFDMGFLEACFKAGLLNYWSGVSVHAYRPTDPETASADFQALRLLIGRYAPRGKQIPIISGEWGYPSSSVGGWKAVSLSEEKQGKLMARQWLSNLANGVPISIWFQWHDDAGNSGVPEQFLGIVRNPYDGSHDPVYSPKPAYLAAQTLTTLLNGYRFSKRLPTAAEDYVLVFGNGGQQRIAVWTVSPTPHSIVIPVSGTFRVTNNLGQEGSPLTASTRGLTVTVSDSPQYLQPQ